MKKIYTLMIAAATSMTMLAAPGKPAVSQVIEKATQEKAVVKELSTPVESRMETRASDAPNLNTYMAYTYYGRTSTDGGENFATCQLQQISDTEVTIYGIFHNYGVKAIYDSSKMTLTINTNQQIIPAEEWDGKEPLMCYIFQIDPSAGTETEVNSLVLTWFPNGVEYTDGSTEFETGCWYPTTPSDVYTQITFQTPSIKGTTSGYKSSWHYANIIYQLEELYPEAGAFTFNPGEWKSVGQSLFFDGWFYCAGEEYSPNLNYGVETYRNYANPGQYLLYQPYGPQAPKFDDGSSYNETPNNPGYIFIDATDPDCVVVRPNVMSGLTNAELFGSSAMIECTSKEGMQYYFDEYSTEEIKDEAALWGDDVSNMTAEGLITIYNCRFGYVPSVDEENYWINSETKEPIEMTARIQLPEGALGVETITDDSSNAPVKYYNLQGQEIITPEKGQIVIKKQGATSVKQIVR